MPAHIQTSLAEMFWPYAPAYMYNRCYKNRSTQKPYIALTGRRPNLSTMRVFGSECYALKQEKKKLDPGVRQAKPGLPSVFPREL